MAMLETAGLTKSYGKARGIIDVDLAVERGEVRLFGKAVGPDDPGSRRSIGFVPSELNFYPGLKTIDLLRYAADLYGVDREKAIREYSERLKLDLTRKVEDLSLGNRKKTAIVQALIHRPDLLILDEPTSGLDPLVQASFHQILTEERDRGATVFFSSHTLSEVERLCDKVAIIREGRIIRTGYLEELKRFSLKRFRIKWEGERVPVGEKLSALIPGAEFIGPDSPRTEGLYGGPVKELLKRLATLPVEDLTLEDPSLEEVFMHFYQNGEEVT